MGEKKEFPLKYIVMGFPILLSLFAGIPALIAIRTNDTTYQKSARVAEAKVQLKEIVDLVLQQPVLNVDLLALGYRPEGKLANVYGLNPKCFPKFKNTHLIEVSKLKQPLPLFKWESAVQKNLNFIEEKLLAQPCDHEGKVLIYAFYVEENGTTPADLVIKGWSMDLEHKMEELK